MPLRHPLISKWFLKPRGLFHHAPAILGRSSGILHPAGIPGRATVRPFSFNRPNPLTRRTFQTSNLTSPSKPRGDASRRLNSSRADQPLSFSQRMRKLSREYGWSALGVYLLLSALDFPFCFAAVRLLGVDRIGHFEQVIVDTFKSVLPATGGSEADSAGVSDDGPESQIALAERRNQGEEASIWTQLALAYAIHKSFIFIRVPLTAAVTPKVVKILRHWGWNIGKRRPKNT